MDQPTSDSPLDRRFPAFYEEHVDAVYGFVKYRVKGGHEAEDLTQVVFEKAFRARGRFDPARASERTWVLSIARNTLIDHLRRRREELVEPEVLEAEIGADIRGQAADPELAALVAELPEREQAVIALRFGADMSGNEIAELLGISADNAYQILSRTLKRLREGLGPSAERADSR